MSASTEYRPQKAYIKTFGCQMNEQDSSQMLGLLSESGFAASQDPYDADLILLNTCSIREKAVQKIYSELGRIRPLKEDHPQLIVGVAGCVAEQEKENISKRFPFLDLLFGPDHIRHLPKMVDEVLAKRQEQGRKKKTLHRTGFEKRQDFEFVNVLPAAEESVVKAFVNIQKGCDNICSFCIVPFVRGREVSRPHQQIIDEINLMVDRGVKEVTLLGQNVNSYGLKTDEVTFAQLLQLISEKTQLKRLRFTTSHPKDVKDDLIEQYQHNPILMPHFHLPVQSGSNRVLKAMKRQYTREQYLDTVYQLKKRIPHIKFSTDIIVGFPTETDAEFEQTLSLMEDVRYDQCFSFVYSPRPYTKAIKLEDDVLKEDKSERLQVLQRLDKRITMEQNEAEVGQTHQVLIEERDEQENGEVNLKGRTPTNKIVHFVGEAQMGDMVTVKITQANPHSLYGERTLSTSS